MKPNTTTVRELIRNLHNAGLHIAVRCPEEGDVLLKASRDQSEREIVEHLTSMDTTLLVAIDLDTKLRAGRALIVWDVGPGEEIADWTESLEHHVPNAPTFL